jgi:DNA-binding GntR family transcriptional regulator
MHYFRIHTEINTPLYQQIVDSVTLAIDQGVLHHLDALPSESQIALMFHISPIVVKQAYQILKQMRLIHTVKGGGSFINLRPMMTFDYLLFNQGNFLQFDQQPWLYLGRQTSSESMRLQFKSQDHFPTWVTKRIAMHQRYPVLYESITMIDGFKDKNFVDLTASQSLAKLMPVLTGKQTTSQTLVYQPMSASEEVALALDITQGDPVHRWRVSFYLEQTLIAIGYYHFPSAYVQLRRVNQR